MRYLALASAVVVLAVAPISTRTDNQHSLTMALFFLAAIVLPTALLWRQNIITFKFWPDKLDWVDVAYTLLSIPLAWGGFRLYFGVLSPEVPFNWTLPPAPDTEELLRLFLGINAVGIWDELFFVNIGYAVLRTLLPARVANLAQAVLYTAVLYDMAFTGWGPLFVYTLALTQGSHVRAFKGAFVRARGPSHRGLFSLSRDCVGVLSGAVGVVALRMKPPR